MDKQNCYCNAVLTVRHTQFYNIFILPLYIHTYALGVVKIIHPFCYCFLRNGTHRIHICICTYRTYVFSYQFLYLMHVNGIQLHHPYTFRFPNNIMYYNCVYNSINIHTYIHAWNRYATHTRDLNAVKSIFFKHFLIERQCVVGT